LDVVSDLGIAPAVIYHRDEDEVASTAFWLSLLVALFLFGMTWFGAPLIGLYFRDDRAVPLIRVLAFTYPVFAFGSIHEALLRKKLAFGRGFIPDFFQAFTKGGVSIVFALLGFGAWSLIIGQLAGTAIAVVVLWWVTGWRPAFEFARNIARSLLKYGLNIVGVDTLGILLLNLDYLLVGRYMGAESLGVYTLAFRIPDLLILQFTRIISTVIFPIYTKMRDVRGSLAKGFLVTCQYVSLVTVPIGLGFMLLARPFVLFFLTPKWQEVIPVTQAVALYAIFISMFYNVGSVYKAQGRPQVLTWLGMLRLAMLAPGLLWAVTGPKSLVAVGWVHVVVAFLSGIINFIAADRLLKIGFLSLLNSLQPAIVSGTFLVLAAGLALWIGKDSPYWLQLAAGTTAGGAAYFFSLWVFYRDIARNVVSTLGQAMKRG
jgi:PST family polysaccharide transporter